MSANTASRTSTIRDCIGGGLAIVVGAGFAIAEYQKDKQSTLIVLVGLVVAIAGIALFSPRILTAIQSMVSSVAILIGKGSETPKTSQAEASEPEEDDSHHTTIDLAMEDEEPDEAVSKASKALSEIAQRELGFKTAPPSLAQADTNLIRQSLFEISVPTYILNKDYHVLDWNPAFEVAFGDDCRRFKRLRHVSQIVNCFENADEVIQRGGKIFGRSEKPMVDLESLEYNSEKFGNIQFSKITSRATHPETGAIIGWNVVLAPTCIQKREEYEERLSEELREQVMWRVYAAAYDRVLNRYSGYQDLVRRHCDAVSARRQILDVGSGTGNVTLQLLKHGCQVTAIDYNEAMLTRLREKCRPYTESKKLKVVKQNLDTMRLSSKDRRKYDGAIAQNVLYALDDPGRCLKLIRESLDSKGILVLSGPQKTTNLDKLFADIRSELKKTPDWDGLQYDFENVVARNQDLETDNLIHRWDIDEVQDMLTKSGFNIVEADANSYSGQAMFVVARKKD